MPFFEGNLSLIYAFLLRNLGRNIPKNNGDLEGFCEKTLTLSHKCPQPFMPNFDPQIIKKLDSIIEENLDEVDFEDVLRHDYGISGILYLQCQTNAPIEK